MRSLLSQKKALVSALLEDMIFLVFLLGILTSGLEILLPGIMSAKIPLALIFSFLALILVLYASLIQEGSFAASKSSFPRSIAIIVFIILALLSLVMNSSFGIMSSLIQIFLISALVSLVFKK